MCLRAVRPWAYEKNKEAQTFWHKFQQAIQTHDANESTFFNLHNEKKGETRQNSKELAGIKRDSNQAGLLYRDTPHWTRRQNRQQTSISPFWAKIRFCRLQFFCVVQKVCLTVLSFSFVQISSWHVNAIDRQPINEHDRVRTTEVTFHSVCLRSHLLCELCVWCFFLSLCVLEQEATV